MRVSLSAPAPYKGIPLGKSLRRYVSNMTYSTIFNPPYLELKLFNQHHFFGFNVGFRPDAIKIGTACQP